MNANQREKLEQELNFLKESFDAEVITEDEYEKGKERIEKKLQEIKGADSGKKEDKKVEAEKYGKIAENSESQKKNEEASSKEEEKEKKIEQGKTQEAGIEESPKSIPVILNLKKDEKKDAAKIELSDEYKKEKTNAEIHKSDGELGRKPKKKKILWIAVLILILGIYLFYGYKNTQQNEITATTEIHNSIGAHNTESSSATLTVINSDECFNCDSSRILGIMKEWFPGMKYRELDYKSEDAKKLVDTLRIDILPAYIFDNGNELEKMERFEDVKGAFSNIEGKYILSRDAAGSTYYIGREPIKMKLDLFIRNGDKASLRAEENVNAFIEASEEEIDFNVIDVESEMAKELGIKIVPAFIINNIIKFSGVQPPEVIKQNFCELNEAEVCKKELSKSLI